MKKLLYGILVLLCIGAVGSLFNSCNNENKNADYNYDKSYSKTEATRTTTTSPPANTQQKVQGVNCELSDESKGTDWLGAINEYKLSWCTNYLSSLKSMGKNTSQATPQEMMKCLDIFYSVSDNLFYSLSIASNDYATAFGMN